MLILDEISKSFGKQRVLKDVSVEFLRNSCSIIVGVNGSGKTTLLNIIAGLSEASSGIISIDWENLSGSKEYKEKVFYIPSDFYLPEFMTGREYANFVFSRYRTSRQDCFQDAANLFGLSDALDKMIGAFSFGMKKKLQLAIAACLGVDFLLVDEGMTGLDFETTLLAQELFASLAETTGIILVSHDMDTVRRFPDQVFLLKDSCLAPYTGTIDALPKVVSEDVDYEARVKLVEKLRTSL